MNKKILYALIFTSLFVMSTISIFAQPVAGASYDFGVPNEAKGMTLQSEVKAYDKDTWGDCIGLNPDDRAAQAYGNYREGYSPDANNVGARSQSEINDWESDEWWFMGDTLLWTKLDESIRNDPEYDRTGDKISDLIYYWDAITFARNTILGLAGNNLTGEIDWKGLYYKPLIQAVWLIVKGGRSAGLTAIGILGAPISTAINNTEGLGVGLVPDPGAWASTYSIADVSSLYSKKYDAVVVDRDVWYWEKTAEFESDPDEEGVETPFIEDPEDLYDAFNYFVAMTEALFAQTLAITEDMDTFLGLTNYSKWVGGQYWHCGGAGIGGTGYNSSWDFINTTLYNQIKALSGVSANYAELLYAINTFYAHDAVYAWWSLVKGGLEVDLVEFFRSKIPDRAEFLLLLLKSGIPAHQDVNNWLENLIDAFHIDEEQYWNVDDEPFQLDVSVDGLVVTAEITWADSVMNYIPGEDLEERKDYDMVFTYSDTGGQSSLEYVKGDEVFFKTEGIAPTIPGFEISILLGAAAISALGLIFVVMKKRRM